MLEHISIKLDINTYVEEKFHFLYSRDGVPIKIEPYIYQNFFDISCCVNHVPLWPLKSLVIYYCNRNEIEDCHEHMASCMNRFFRKYIDRFECLWVPISIKEDFVLVDSYTLELNPMIFSKLHKMVTWVCITLKFLNIIEFKNQIFIARLYRKGL